MTISDKYVRKNIKDGIIVAELSSWEEFNEFLSGKMVDYKQYIWRGQRLAKWNLESTLDRMLKRKKANKNRVKNEHLKKFKYATRGRRGNNPPNIDSDNEWWALGQHHGLATPLLDWTTSPYVAAYFAYWKEHKEKNKEENETDRAIFALNKEKVKRKVDELNNKNPLIDNKIEFVNPLSDDNPRLVNQSGLFTKSPLGMTIEEWIRKHFKGSGKVVLLKVILPNSERNLILKLLNRMNINHLTLFPDLIGASKFCNMSLEIDSY